MPYRRQIPVGWIDSEPSVDEDTYEVPESSDDPEFYGLEALLAHCRSLWDRAETSAEGLAEALGWPDWMTCMHVVFRSHTRPVVIEVGVDPAWTEPVQLPRSVDGFPIEAIPRERAVALEDGEEEEVES